MNFEENKTAQRWGEKAGYVFAFFLFTTIFFYILSWFGRIERNAVSYFYVFAAIAVVSVIGYFLEEAE